MDRLEKFFETAFFLRKQSQGEKQKIGPIEDNQSIAQDGKIVSPSQQAALHAYVHTYQNDACPLPRERLTSEL